MPPPYLFGKSMFDKLTTALRPGLFSSFIFSILTLGTHAGNMSEFMIKPLHIDSIIPGSRLSYPLRLILAKTYVKDNIVLVG